MACACQKKKAVVTGKSIDPPTTLESNFFAKAGDTDMVPLCLADHINLPVSLPEAYATNGILKDVVVIPEGTKPYDKVVNIVGRHGLVPRKMRNDLMRKYPNSFSCKEIEVTEDAVI